MVSSPRSLWSDLICILATCLIFVTKQKKQQKQVDFGSQFKGAVSEQEAAGNTASTTRKQSHERLRSSSFSLLFSEQKLY